MHNWNSPDQPKKSDHTWKARPAPALHMLYENQWRRSVSRATLEERRFPQLWSKRFPLPRSSSGSKMESAQTAASCFNKTIDKLRLEKWPTVPLYLDELLDYIIETCKFRNQVEVSNILPRKVFPKGSCHLGGFFCGMHWTCKKHHQQLNTMRWT